MEKPKSPMFREHIKKHYFTKENAAAMAKKGAENHRKTMTVIRPLRDLAKEILRCRPKEEVVNQMIEMFPELDAKKISVKTAMLYAQVMQALNGDLNAFKEIRDLIGEKPTENINLNVNDNTTIRERYLQLREQNRIDQENADNNS